MRARRINAAPLFQSKELCGRCNRANVLVKDGSRNPFGTFKDIRNEALLEAHSGKKEVVFVQITSGNSGYSLGMLAQEEERRSGRKIHVVNIVDKGLSKVIKERLGTCSVVHEMDLSDRLIAFDELRDIAKKVSAYEGSEQNIVDVESYKLVNSYGRIMQELHEEEVYPDRIYCPVGSGELLTELATEGERIWGISRSPVIVGATIEQNVFCDGKNFLKKPGKNVADKLVSSYSKYAELIHRFVKNRKVTIQPIREREIVKEYEYLNKIGISVEPSAATAFCAAEMSGVMPNETIVIINTGKGIYDPNAVDKFWVNILKRTTEIIAKACVIAGITAAIVTGASTWVNYKMGLEETVRHWTDTNADRIVDEKEEMAACLSLPGMNEAECSDTPINEWSIGQLKHFLKDKRLETPYEDEIIKEKAARIIEHYDCSRDPPNLCGIKK